MTEQLQHILQSTSYLWPEIWLTAAFALVLLLEICLKHSRFKIQTTDVLHYFTVASLLISVVLVFEQRLLPKGFLFNDFLFLDHQAVIFKLLTAIGGLVVLFHIRVMRTELPDEAFSLIISSLLGVYLMTMAVNWLSIFLSIELLSVSSYILVALAEGKKPAEGGLKYLLFGAVSAAIMLYGISWIYGLTGSLGLQSMAHLSPQIMSIVGLMALAGVFFKLSLVPFQIWAPDAYEAAPTPIVAFISTAPKIGALLVLSRLTTVFGGQFQLLLSVVAIVSIFVGNLSALRQADFKRMMAYSSIAQAGFLVLGLVAYNQSGVEAMTFYVAVYLFMNLAAFFVVDLLGNRQTKIEDFAGLGSQKIWLSVALLIIMVSLVGLPPTAGFSAKLFIFTSLWESYQNQPNHWLLWLIGLGLLNAVISLFYYLKLPYYLFFRKTPPPAPPHTGRGVSSTITPPPSMGRGLGSGVLAYILIFLLTLPLLWWFFAPSSLMNLIKSF